MTKKTFFAIDENFESSNRPSSNDGPDRLDCIGGGYHGLGLRQEGSAGTANRFQDAQCKGFGLQHQPK
jgi:hypothetical protein